MKSTGELMAERLLEGRDRFGAVVGEQPLHCAQCLWRQLAREQLAGRQIEGGQAGWSVDWPAISNALGLSRRPQNPHVDAELASFEQRRIGSDQWRLQRRSEHDVRRVVDRQVLA